MRIDGLPQDDLTAVEREFPGAGKPYDPSTDHCTVQPFHKHAHPLPCRPFGTNRFESAATATVQAAAITC